jgi:hypothetical protein
MDKAFDRLGLRAQAAQKTLAPPRKICISARSAAGKAGGFLVATVLDDIPARPLFRQKASLRAAAGSRKS